MGIRTVSGLIPAIALSVCATIASAQPLAFPGAEGWAASTPGGRGGAILFVDNLNASGPDSLQAALDFEGPRIIVFNIGGTIDMDGDPLTVTSPFLTLAGQTAPYPGITIIDGSLLLDKTHDVVIQHIRVRPGAARHVGQNWEPDGIAANACHHVIVDHCSISWAVDENLSASGPRFDGATPDDWRANTSRQITFSNNIIAEGLSIATHAEGEHSKGSLIHDNTSDIAIIKNLYAQNTARNPVFKAGARGAIVNNVVYNPGQVAIHFSSVIDEWESTLQQPNIASPEIARISAIGNALFWGPSNSASINPIPFFVTIDEFATDPILDEFVALELYLDDNLAYDNTGTPNPQIPLLTNQYGDPVPQYLVPEKPTWIDNIDVIPTSQLSEYIFQNAGARPWEKDSVDDRIRSDWQSLNGSSINFETEVGGFPIATARHRPLSWDTDNDGMPDSWERLHGTNPNSADSQRIDLSETGYTNIEVYLHELSALRSEHPISLYFKFDPERTTLAWGQLPENGKLEQSLDLQEWQSLDPNPSISGEHLFDEKLPDPVFIRWRPNP